MEAATDYTRREVEKATVEKSVYREFTVVVLGHENNEPFSFVARGRQGCADELKRRGFEITDPNVGAGYMLYDDPMLIGKCQEANRLVEQHLRSKR